MATLFPSERVCVVCGSAAPANSKIFAPGQPVIVALNVTIYRKTRAGRQLATGRQVRVCEECLTQAVASRGGRLNIKAASLAVAIFERIAERYSAMCEAKE